MKKILFLLYVSLLANICAYADGVQFTASAPKAVVKGEQFRVSYTVTTQRVKDFRAPSFEGFEVLMGPSTARSSSSSIDGSGNMTSTSRFTYTYVLMAVQEGDFSISGASVVADGEVMTSNSLNIKVLPPDQTTGQQQNRGQDGRSNASTYGHISNNDLFITATVNNTTVYEQEAILLTYKVYFLVNLRELEIKMPNLKGFLTQEVELQRGQPTLEHYNGRNYNTIVWSQYVLFPQQTGQLEIPSIDFDATIAVRTQRNIDPFDIFMNGGAGYVDVRKTISTPKLIVNVSPLPTGKPASFAGGVGEFDIKSSITATELKLNEAVTLKLEISGVGNMKLISTPEVDFPQDFEIYDPKVENQFSLTRSGLAGKKVIEYLAIPRHAGTFTIPSIEFSYFDLKSKSYKTLSTDAYELHVAKGDGNLEQPIISSFTNKENVRLIGQDIRYIKTGDVSFYPKGKFLFGSIVYYLCYIVPLLLIIALGFVYRKRAIENANVSMVRTKNANKVAVKRLKVASRLLKENRKEEFFDEILRALWGYVSDKMNMPIANLSKDNVAQELLKCNVNKKISDEFINVLNDCEFARYAPTMNADNAMDKIYSVAVDVISKIEDSIK